MARQATGFLADFQAFILNGNVVDLAVAVIIGGAFGKVIDSLVTDIITPAILAPALKAAGAENLAALKWGTIPYGSFLAALINFLVIALSIFIMIRALESAKKKFARHQAEEAVAEAAADPVLVSQTRLTSAVERLSQVMESR
jgi:large conductance mechanosensitive channel